MIDIWTDLDWSIPYPYTKHNTTLNFKASPSILSAKYLLHVISKSMRVPEPIDTESTRNHIKTISQVDFKNNDLYKSTKSTNNPHSILLKLRNPHNPHSCQGSSKKEISMETLCRILERTIWFKPYCLDLSFLYVLLIKID